VTKDSQSSEQGDAPEIKVKDRRRFSAEGELLETAEETGGDDAASGKASSAVPIDADAAASIDADAAVPIDADAAEAAPAAEAAGEAPAQKAQQSFRPEPPPPRGEQAPPMPPANFEMLILSLAMQAQMELGGGGVRGDGQAPNLDIARHTIDVLAMLQEKTKGNLSMEENRMLENSLTELRFRYVQVVADINKKPAS